ncbi:Ribosome biogenesis protein tsr1 (20S rrna accumulation protein 1) [Operophtera brumata]|uniref:Pre-rRNA-processing protein TSR1 homolog n=1 Tax=Operophtera brumata TaxID=104452 RepID=A0A0L7L9J7_OPEBR|nr:Ribosome biogenesis protein tsr1 (20S rrna accumulation protein 1) [Operophtera brumata]
MQQAHRAGNLKQSNKSHKSRHRSKRGIAAAVKGKVNVKEFVRRNRHVLKKEERRHQALQIRKNKREESMNKKRALGGTRFPPFLVCVVPLNRQLDVNSALAILKSCSEGAVATESPNGILHIALPNFKQRFSFISPEVDNDFSLLDALKVADTALFISSALDEPVDEWGEKVLALAMAQGMPTPVVVAMDIEGVHPKKRTTEKQNVQKLISKWLPEEKVMQLDKNSDGLNLFRRIGNQKRNVIHHREKRPYMLAEEVEYVPESDGKGTLKVSGYLRGMPLNVNGLVHITGLGDFQMSRIDGLEDPHPLTLGKETGKSDTMEAEVIKVSVLQKADPAKQESLVSENVPDLMDAEQTWPTNQEIEQANIEKVPKGWSDYQAAWIVESDAEDNSEYESGSDAEDDEQFMSLMESEVGPTDEKYDDTVDAFEEHEVLKKLAAAREDQLYPDEVDTPQYGFYITIHIKDVRQDLWQAFHASNGTAPLSLFGLLPHEQKMSVMNVALKRTGVSDEPIRSKDRLVFQVGYRRFIVNPIFSQHTNGSKHKLKSQDTVLLNLYKRIYPKWNYENCIVTDRDGKEGKDVAMD